MDVVDALLRLGGVSSHRALVAATSRWHVRAAVSAGRIERLGYDTYALPGHDDAIAHACRLSGVLGELSAARHWEWATWRTPRRPTVVVPPKRRVARERRAGVRVLWRDAQIDGIATAPTQTVLDCARSLPFPEALAVADSALRSGLVGRHELIDAAARLPRPGRARRVAALADPRAANPFESVVRAHALDVPGLHLVPQVSVVGYGDGDLVDVRRRLIVECDGFRWHSSRAALINDIERYNRAAQIDATVIRFAYEHAQNGPFVQRVLTDWVTRPPSRQEVLPHSGDLAA